MNQRPIRSAMIGAALKEALGVTVQSGRHAVAILFMTLEPDTVDVNVHPAKIEVRFKNERTIFTGIVKMLRSVINKEKFIPKIETSTETQPIPIDESKLETKTSIASQPFTRPQPTETTVSPQIESRTLETQKTEEKPTEVVGTESKETLPTEETETDPSTEETKTVVQPSRQAIPEGATLKLLDFDNVELKTNLFKTYIVAEGEDKIFFIDQHVAAERVLYERFVNQLKTDGIPVQGLLLPVTVEVTPQQLAILKVHAELFSKVGFELEEFGANTILIRAIPAPLPTRTAAQTITDLLDKLTEKPHTEVEIPEAVDDALITLACRSAVKAGDSLDSKEMINLIRELSEAKLPFNCPHSRPIIVEMGRDELERRFHRS